MKKYFTLILLLQLCLFSFGQSISSEVVATAGDLNESRGYSLSWTIGESVTETFQNDNYLITQGFQQSYFYQITEVADSEIVKGYNISIFPNPATEFFYIKFNNAEERPPLKLIMFNTAGSKVKESVIDPDIQQYRVNIHQFTTEIIHMTLMDDASGFVKRFKIVKINQ